MKIVKAVVLLLLIAGVSAWAYVRSESYRVDAAAQNWIFQDAKVFDGQVWRTGVTVVIKDGRFDCVAEQCAIPPEAEVVDATDLALLPGLVDLHVHYGAPTRDFLDKSRFAQLADHILLKRPDVRRSLLEYGVTTIRSVGDGIPPGGGGILNLRKAIEEGELEGPRLFVAGPLFTAPQGHPDGTIFKSLPEYVRASIVRLPTSRNEAREAVSALAVAGVDGIKAVYDAGSARRQLPRLDDAALQAIGESTDGHELWLAVHVRTGEELARAVAAGATTIEHGPFDGSLPPPDAIIQMRRNGVVYVPTLAVQASNSEDPIRLEGSLTALRHMHTEGVLIGLGTDTQGNMRFGEAVYQEMRLLARAGLSEEEVLQAATSVGAHALGKASELGHIAPGHHADLVAFPRDALPLQDEEVRPLLVLKGGRKVVDQNI